MCAVSGLPAIAPVEFAAGLWVLVNQWGCQCFALAPCLPCPLPREVVLDAASDEFYVRHRYSNYGEVGLAVKEAVEKFGAASALHRQVR